MGVVDKNERSANAYVYSSVLCTLRIMCTLLPSGGAGVGITVGGATVGTAVVGVDAFATAASEASTRVIRKGDIVLHLLCCVGVAPVWQCGGMCGWCCN